MDTGRDRERLDPRSDPAVRFAMLGIVDEELDQSAPELAEELQERADHPDDFGVPGIAPIPDTAARTSTASPGPGQPRA